jgi:hypothetical protein
MHDLFETTVPHGKILIKEDPVRLVRRGYILDSKRAPIKMFPNKLSLLPGGFLSLRPEGPRNKY